MVDGVLWLLKAGSPWRDLPEEFGPWETVYTWFDRWTSDGTLDEILRRLKAAMSETEDFDHELWCIDGTVVRAHRCAAGGGKKGSLRNRKITLSAGREVVFRQRSTSFATDKAIRSTPK
jgi:transposase